MCLCVCVCVGKRASHFSKIVGNKSQGFVVVESLLGPPNHPRMRVVKRMREH